MVFVTCFRNKKFNNLSGARLFSTFNALQKIYCSRDFAVLNIYTYLY